MKKKPRPAGTALTRQREREELARLLPGGTADNPMELASASLVEVRASSTPCPLCGGELRLEDHSVREHGAVHLRVARVRCRKCHSVRELFYRLKDTRPN